MQNRNTGNVETLLIKKGGFSYLESGWWTASAESQKFSTMTICCESGHHRAKFLLNTRNLLHQHSVTQKAYNFHIHKSLIKNRVIARQ